LNVAAGDVVSVEGSLVTVESASDGSNQSGNVNGSLSCQTSALSNGTSPVNVYTLSSCSGLSDPGYSVVYDYPNSWYQVVPAPLTISPSPSTTTIGLGSPLPTFTPLFSGLIPGDSLATFSLAGNSPPTCTASVPNSSTPTNTTADPTSCQGAADPNYTITYQTGSLWINSVPSPSPDLLGSSVALSGDGQWALVGAPGATVNGKTNAGEVEVYQLTGPSSNPWTKVGVISLDSNGGPGALSGDHFGFSVALNGDGSVALIGAPGRTLTVNGLPNPNAGAAETFTRSATGSGISWTFDHQLDLATTARGGPSWCPSYSTVTSLSSVHCGDEMGFSVSLDSGQNPQNLEALVGAPFRHFRFNLKPVLKGVVKSHLQVAGQSLPVGAAELYKDVSGTWGAPTGLSLGAKNQPYQELGYSVALNRDDASDDGTVAVVGAPLHNPRTGANNCPESTTNAGAAFVYSRLTSGWTAQPSQLDHGCSGTSPFVLGALPNDHLGASVAVSSNGQFALTGSPERPLPVQVSDVTLAPIHITFGVHNGATTKINFPSLSTLTGDNNLSLGDLGDAVIISGPACALNGHSGFDVQIQSSTPTSAILHTPGVAQSCPVVLSTGCITSGMNRVVAHLCGPQVHTGTITVVRSSAGAAQLYNLTPPLTSPKLPVKEFTLGCDSLSGFLGNTCGGATQMDQPTGATNDHLGTSVALTGGTAALSGGTDCQSPVVKPCTPLYALVGAPGHSIDANLNYGDRNLVSNASGAAAGAAEFFSGLFERQQCDCEWQTEMSLGLDANAGATNANHDNLATAVALATMPSAQILPKMGGCASGSQQTWSPTALLGAPHRTVTGTNNAGTADFYTLNPQAYPAGCYWSQPPEEQNINGPTILPRSLVQLGDSVGAGEGTLYGYQRSPVAGYWWGSATIAAGFLPCTNGCGWTNPQYSQCHNSPYAYGQQIASSLNAQSSQPQMNFMNLACTGASFDQDNKGTGGGIAQPELFNEPNVPNVPAQFGQWTTQSLSSSPDGATFQAGADLNHSYFEASPNAVTITDGGNEVQFAKVVGDCVIPDLIGSIADYGSQLLDKLATAVVGPWSIVWAVASAVLYVVAFVLIDLHCTHLYPGSDWTHLVEPEIPQSGTGTPGQATANLTTLANWISERAQADMQPPPQVIMTQYMQQLNDSGWCNDDWPWWIGTPPAPLNDPPLSVNQRLLFISGIDGFNQAISDVKMSVSQVPNPYLIPNASGYLTIAQQPDFSQHQWCSDSPFGFASVFHDAPWAYTLSTRSFQVGIPADLSDGPQSGAPFHPTPCGQTQIANIVGNVLTSEQGLSWIWNANGISCPSGQP
jgi:hypothetical protein